jgi:CarD family transcriptional regulator
MYFPRLLFLLERCIISVVGELRLDIGYWVRMQLFRIYERGSDMYNIGDQIVHPMHGAGIIESVEQRDIDGEKFEYYVFRMPSSGMSIMLPTDNCTAIGVRPVMPAEEAERLLLDLGVVKSDMTPNWSRRFRENLVKIKSGDLMEVAAVIKGLMEREKQKALSSGERDMLRLAKQIIISELALSKAIDYNEMEQEVCRIMRGD